MKIAYIKLTVFISLILAFSSCGDNMGEKDTRLAAVSKLVEPIDGKEIILLPSPAATAYFEWEYCDVAASGAVVYQIAFDKADGNFSNPVYTMLSDNNGLYNHATVTHKQLNKIAGMMGIGASETGSFKWTVFSVKGLNSQKASQEQSIKVTRLAGFAELPIDVFVTGEASEGGTDLSKAHKMKAVENGVFEVYTQLTANKPFNFTDRMPEKPRTFYTDGELIRENGSTTVSADGVYLIKLDFVTGACSYSLVTRLGFYFSPDGAILFDLPYIGNGIFRAENQTVTFKQEGWGRDQRYKFRMFVKENNGADPEKELEWGTLNGTDSPPTMDSPASYYYLKLLTDLSQWDNKWKLMSDFDGVPATYTVYLQADAPYTHSVIK
ncbi:MAG: SusE domain-containing protein [Dysgonamonadaceae bacterium]|jgi:hypothetical protein|nr:SusE domain-containing protein [Dysgonamonadaceae bacterium]